MSCGLGADRSRSEGKGYVIVTCLSEASDESRGGFLAKRASNAAGDPPESKVKRAAKTVRGGDVRLEDDPTAGGGAAEGAPHRAAENSAKPFQQPECGAGAVLYKCTVASA